MWKSEQQRLKPKYDIVHSLLSLVKQYNVTMDEDDNKFKIICQRCNDFVTCSGRRGKLIYINFLHAGMSTLGLYPEEVVSENFCFRWPPRTKMQHIYQNLLKEVNSDHKYLRCTDIQDTKF